MTGAGDLDQRITIEVPANVPDGRGGVVKGWATLAKVWAKVRPISGRERAIAGQVEASALYRVTIRRRADVTPDCRIRWNGRVMNVRFPADAGAREPFLTLDCDAGVPT